MINARNLFHYNALVMLDLHSREAMERLGRAFAGTLKKDWEDTAADPARIDRIALVAMPDTGKSVFMHGLTGAFSGAIKLEDQTYIVSAEKSHPQALWHTYEAGFIRHLDAGFFQNYPTRVLKPYRFEYLEKNSQGGTDIIENADRGLRSDSFDAALRFDKFMAQDNSRYRKAYIYATPEFQKRPGFHSFLKAASTINKPDLLPEIS